MNKYAPSVSVIVEGESRRTILTCYPNNPVKTNLTDPKAIKEDVAKMFQAS